MLNPTALLQATSLQALSPAEADCVIDVMPSDIMTTGPRCWPGKLSCKHELLLLVQHQPAGTPLWAQ